VEKAAMIWEAVLELIFVLLSAWVDGKRKPCSAYPTSVGTAQRNTSK
jgi:hypothetical protein